MTEEDWGGLDIAALVDEHRAEMDDLARDEKAGEFRATIRAEAVANVAEVTGLSVEALLTTLEFDTILSVLVDAEETLIWDQLDD